MASTSTEASYISTKSTHTSTTLPSIIFYFSIASGKYGSQDLAQYNAWEQLEIFRTRLKIESSPQKEENEPQKQNDPGEIF